MPLGPHLPKGVPRMRGAAVSRSPLCPSAAGAHLYDAHVPARTCACRCMQCMPACVCMCMIVYVHGKCVCLCVCVRACVCVCLWVIVPVGMYRFAHLWMYIGARMCTSVCYGHMEMQRVVCTAVYTCACGGMCAHESACACVPVQIGVCTPVRVHVCARPCLYVHVHTYGHVHASVHMRVCVSAHAPSIRVCVHTDPHWYVYPSVCPSVCLYSLTPVREPIRVSLQSRTSPCVRSTPAQVRPRVRPCVRASVPVSVYPCVFLFPLHVFVCPSL